MLLWLFQSCRRRATYSDQVAAMCHVGLQVPQCEWSACDGHALVCSTGLVITSLACLSCGANKHVGKG